MTTTVASLAELKHLPAEYLSGLGLENLDGGGVAIPYRAEDGEEMFARARDVRGQKFYQPKGVSLAAYGLWKLDMARRAEYVVLVEGESDCWALWRHGIPALGLPGSGAAGCLRPEFFDGIGRVYVWREPDDGGAQFVRGCLQRLRDMHFQGSVWQLELQAFKDPCDLHSADPDHFEQHWPHILESARTLDRTPSLNGQATKGTPSTSSTDFIRQRMTAVESIRHDDLLDADLPPPSYIVAGLIVDDGLTFLGGKKKLGKSWLCLQVAQAVAGGVNCLGRATATGPVVYICLEDGRRRVKDRLGKQQAARGLPITYFTRFPPLDGEGMVELVRLVEADHPRLVIIDTLAAAKTGKTVENDAGPMADLTNSLRILAQHFRLGVLVTHHHGKSVGGDPGDDLRGSSAIASAADLSLGLYREEGIYILRGEGRDIDQLSLRLEFDMQHTWAWQVVGETRQVGEEELDKELLEALSVLGEADADAVAAALNRHKTTACKRLVHLAALGRIVARNEENGKRGRPRTLYRLPFSADTPARNSDPWDETTCDENGN